MSLHWSARYVGTPYVDHGRELKGCDCWGLIRLVLAVEKGIRVPSYDDVSPDEVREIAAILSQEVATFGWRAVWKANEFDVAVFRRGRFDSHVGMMVDRRQMLHSDKYSGGARVERVDAGRWQSQFVGFYRHRDLF